MSQPVMTKDGINFEREDILQFLETVDYCPITGNPLSPSCLVPNAKLLKEIEKWIAETGEGIQSYAMDFEDAKAAIEAKKMDSHQQKAVESLRSQAREKMKKSSIKATFARSA